MKRIATLAIFVFFLSVLNGQSVPKWKMTKLEEYISSSESPLVISFWATYCIPCIKEIPYFEELVKKNEAKGVKLLLVSLDFEESYPDKIKKISNKLNFTAPIVWLDETNADYFCPKIDGNWSGVMPATLFINNKTGYRSFFQEEIPKQKFEEELNKMFPVK